MVSTHVSKTFFFYSIPVANAYFAYLKNIYLSFLMTASPPLFQSPPLFSFYQPMTSCLRSHLPPASDSNLDSVWLPCALDVLSLLVEFFKTVLKTTRLELIFYALTEFFRHLWNVRLVKETVSIEKTSICGDVLGVTLFPRLRSGGCVTTVYRTTTAPFLNV